MEETTAKTILSKNKSTGWFGCEYNMNLYRGCCHGCIYCDSRSDCYRVEQFETVRAKKDALLLLRNELSRKVKSGVICSGAMSDPYNPFEKGEQLTRHSLELVYAYHFGIFLTTKSALIVRDQDVLADIKAQAPVLTAITITTADEELCRKIEPHVSGTGERFAAMEQLAAAGIPSGTLLMPILPHINDTPENVREILRRTANSGGKYVYGFFGLTMRDGQREYLYDQMDRDFPGMRERYEKEFGNRYQCHSPKSQALWNVLLEECDRLGLLYKMQDIIRLYRSGYDTQLSFF